MKDKFYYYVDIDNGSVWKQSKPLVRNSCNEFAKQVSKQEYLDALKELHLTDSDSQIRDYD